MTTSQTRPGDIASRAVGLLLLGLATCALLWLFVNVGDRPTGRNHATGETYLPDGLYLATALSLLMAFAVTVASDFILGRSTWTAFVTGFIVGVIVFFWNIPWSQLDYGAGEMFGIAMWWLPPILGTVTYVGKAVINEFR